MMLCVDAGDCHHRERLYNHSLPCQQMVRFPKILWAQVLQLEKVNASTQINESNFPLPEEHSWNYWYSLTSLQQVPLPEPPSHCACGRDRRRRPRMTPCTYLAKKFPLRCNSCCFYCLCNWGCSRFCCCYCCCYSRCWLPKMIPCSYNAKKSLLKSVCLRLLSSLLAVLFVLFSLFWCLYSLLLFFFAPGQADQMSFGLCLWKGKIA